MKTLVIVAHPNMQESKVNMGWLEELSKHNDKFTIHKLYEVYPDGKIDVQKEQQLVEAHDKLVLQFPIYWFNCPPLMKQWLDEVLTYGWAYGSTGDKLTKRKTALAVTAGIDKDDFTAEGEYGHTLEEVLVPFEVAFKYCKADYEGFIAYYGATEDATEEKIGKSLPEYLDFLNR